MTKSTLSREKRLQVVRLLKIKAYAQLWSVGAIKSLGNFAETSKRIQVRVYEDRSITIYFDGAEVGSFGSLARWIYNGEEPTYKVRDLDLRWADVHFPYRFR